MLGSYGAVVQVSSEIYRFDKPFTPFSTDPEAVSSEVGCGVSVLPGPRRAQVVDGGVLSVSAPGPDGGWVREPEPSFPVIGIFRVAMSRETWTIVSSLR